MSKITKFMKIFAFFVGMAVLVAGGILLPGESAWAVEQVNGDAKMNVSAISPWCLAHKDQPPNAVESWDVEQGGQYIITLSNVTECEGDSINDSINVIIHNSYTGNINATAVKVGDTKDYQFTLTMPGDACYTSPVEYCTTDFETGTGYWARRSDGVDKQSHLRASHFETGCTNPTEDQDCQEEGEEIDCSKAYADPGCLWPPNHEMVSIRILGVTGNGVTLKISGITSDEATASEAGAGGPNFAPDASGVGTENAKVRAERSGSGLKDGRVYVISFTAEDRGGNICTGEVKVKVPHDKSDKTCSAVVDSGQNYDATVIN